MEIKQEQRGNVQLLSPVGRLDTDSASDLELALQDAVAAGAQHFVIDLAEIGYVSSAGLRVLASLVKQLETTKGSLRLAGLDAKVKQTFEMAGMAKMFAIYADADAALDKHPHGGPAPPPKPAPAPKAEREERKPEREAKPAPAPAPAP